MRTRSIDPAGPKTCTKGRHRPCATTGDNNKATNVPKARRSRFRFQPSFIMSPRRLVRALGCCPSKFRTWRVRTIDLARTATQRHLPDITPSHVLPGSIPKHWFADVGFELDRLRHKNNPVERSRQTSPLSRAIAREEIWCHTWTSHSAFVL